MSDRLFCILALLFPFLAAVAAPVLVISALRRTRVAHEHIVLVSFLGLGWLLLSVIAVAVGGFLAFAAVFGDPPPGHSVVHVHASAFGFLLVVPTLQALAAFGAFALLRARSTGDTRPTSNHDGETPVSHPSKRTGAA